MALKKMVDYSKFKDYGEYLDYCYEEQYNKVMAARKKEEKDEKQRKQGETRQGQRLGRH